jgi:hypothetical protein
MTNERTKKIDMKFSFHAKRKKKKEIIAHKKNDNNTDEIPFVMVF